VEVAATAVMAGMEEQVVVEVMAEMEEAEVMVAGAHSALVLETRVVVAGTAAMEEMRVPVALVGMVETAGTLTAEQFST